MCVCLYMLMLCCWGSSDESQIIEIKRCLDKAFTIKDLGVAHYFLGMEIARGALGTALNQRKYILDLISNLGLTNSVSVSTPFPP